MKKETTKTAKKVEKKNTKDKKNLDQSKLKENLLIKGLRITEKSSLKADKGQYTFNVSRSATKNEIKKAIKLIYKVVPTKVAIIQVVKKTVVRRGKTGTKSAGKKAVVHLKKGDKIEFV